MSCSRTQHGAACCVLEQDTLVGQHAKDSIHAGVCSFTGMDIITGMDYWNGHYVMALGAFLL